MITDAVYSALAGLVSNRCYPVEALDSPIAPYIVYRRVSLVPENTLSDGVVAKHLRLQVDYYDVGYRSCQSLAIAGQAAIAAAIPSSTLQLELDLPETETKLYHVMNDFNMWE